MFTSVMYVTSAEEKYYLAGRYASMANLTPTHERHLWAGYTYAQEQAWKKERERLTAFMQGKGPRPVPVPQYERD